LENLIKFDSTQQSLNSVVF